MLVTILALIVVLGVLIFVHEAGHFIAAKWAGIYVHRFSLGLGSPIPWLTFKRGETEYSISWLPLGGYVKMASREEEVTSSALEGGHVEAPVPPDRVFEAKPVWKRMVVILAGVTMNALFAWLAFTFLAAQERPPDRPDDHRGPGDRGDGAARRGGPARHSGRARGSSRINGRPVNSWNDVSDGIANSPESEVRLELDGGRTVTLPIHQDALEERLKAAQALQPFRPAVIGQVLPGKTGGAGGAAAGRHDPRDRRPADRPVVRCARGAAGQHRHAAHDDGGRRQRPAHPRLQPGGGDDRGPRRQAAEGWAGRHLGRARHPLRAAEPRRRRSRRAGTATVSASTQIVRTVRGLFTGRISRREVGGPIMIGQLAGESARMGLDPFLAFMALISINLAVLNLLPVPVLDGGQFLFLLAEAVIRRPAAAQAAGAADRGGDGADRPADGAGVLATTSGGCSGGEEGGRLDGRTGGPRRAQR